MNKITPAITSIALAGILTSCGSPTAVEQLPTAPKAQNAWNEAKIPAPVPLGAKTVANSAAVTASGTAVTASGTAAMPADTAASGAVSDVGAVPPAGVPAKASLNIVTKVIAYTSPAGPEEIEVTLGISNNAIASVSVKPMATNEISNKLQTSFAAGVGVSVGKPTALFNLDTVGGASLTTKAFNAYVQSL